MSQHAPSQSNQANQETKKQGLDCSYCRIVVWIWSIDQFDGNESHKHTRDFKRIIDQLILTLQTNCCNVAMYQQWVVLHADYAITSKLRTAIVSILHVSAQAKVPAQYWSSYDIDDLHYIPTGVHVSSFVLDSGTSQDDWDSSLVQGWSSGSDNSEIKDRSWWTISPPLAAGVSV